MEFDPGGHRLRQAGRAAKVANLVTFCRYGPCVSLAMGTRRASVASPARDLQSTTPGRGVGSADDNLSPGQSV